MATVDLIRVKKQVISLIGANERDAISGLRVYSGNSGDEAFLSAEIDTAISYALLEVMAAVCGTDGSPLRGAFVTNTAVNHGEPLPQHYGTPGVPKITPFTGATFTISGVRKSVEEISSYRNNPIVFGSKRLYSDFNHNQNANGQASSLAGYYSIVEGVLYYTGQSAVIPLAVFDESSEDLLPDSVEPTIAALAVGNLAKDGTISEKFSEWFQRGEMQLNLIRNGEVPTPSVKPTIGARDRGTK